MTARVRTRQALVRGACVGAATAAMALVFYLDLRQAALLGVVAGATALGLRLADAVDR
ncbi:hypothetical protein JCM15519_14500 [Fundidesulfovibrio butyratiphilus]